jgi:hypothetical protein
VKELLGSREASGAVAGIVLFIQSEFTGGPMHDDAQTKALRLLMYVLCSERVHSIDLA